MPSEHTMFNDPILDRNKFNTGYCNNTQNIDFTNGIRYKELETEVPDTNKIKLIHLKKLECIESNDKIDVTMKETRKKTENTKYKRIMDNINNVKRSRKVRIPITKCQRSIIFEWFKMCDYTYNKCVLLFNNGEFEGLSKAEFFGKIFTSKDKGCPYDMLTDEFKKFNSNLKSAKSNLMNGHTKSFMMTNKKQCKGRTVFIAKPGITKNGIYPTILGKIEGFSKIVDIKSISSDCMLTYDKLSRNFYLHIPQYYEIKHISGRDKVVAVDPGEKIFMSFYSPTKSGKIGEDVRINVLRYQSDIKKLQKINQNDKNKEGRKIRNKKHVQERINKKFKKIHNMVTELHHQTAKYLCSNYERILIPTFETQKMVRKDRKKYMGTNEEIKEQIREGSKRIRLGRKVKFVLNMLSHYKFRQHLITKSNEYGCQVIECTEEYTTKCCGRCGFLSNTCVNRVKECQKCGYRINRDINGARNILIKNHSMVIESV